MPNVNGKATTVMVAEFVNNTRSPRLKPCVFTGVTVEARPTRNTRNSPESTLGFFVDGKRVAYWDLHAWVLVGGPGGGRRVRDRCRIKSRQVSASGRVLSESVVNDDVRGARPSLNGVLGFDPLGDAGWEVSVDVVGLGRLSCRLSVPPCGDALAGDLAAKTLDALNATLLRHGLTVGRALMTAPNSH